MTIEEFRAANFRRSELWHGQKGESVLFWAVSLAGEVGEACNIIKKMVNKRAQRIGYKDADYLKLKAALGEELADSFTYLFLLADQAGIDLEYDLVRKFNKVSRMRGLPVFLKDRRSGEEL